MRVCVVLPAYNEAGNLSPLVGAVLQAADQTGRDVEIVVVDDGSIDGSADELVHLQRRHTRLRVIGHDTNRGLAAALRTGIAAALGAQCDALVFMDADMSHRPEDMDLLVGALEAGADMVLGSRFIPGSGMRGVPWRRVLISNLGNRVARRLLHVPVRDLTTGYRAFRASAVEKLGLTEDAFTIQLEAVARACAAGLHVVEVPIVLGVRRHGVSHMRYTPQLAGQYWRLLRRVRRASVKQ